MSETVFYQDCLKRVLSERCVRNPRYSIRAFARSLGVDVGALSRILAGKQVPSYKLSQKILSVLELSPEEQERFFASVAEKQRSRNLQRLNPVLRRFKAQASTPADLSIDLYRVIADWYHFAILELTFIEDLQSSPSWIAKELGIPVAEATLAIERLIKLNLLKIESGRYIKTEEQLSTMDKHLTTPALRRNQEQFLEKAIDSLENDPIEERNMSSMTMAIDPDRLPIAKQLIREFNQSLCRFLESGKRRRVYNLEIALYPIQSKKKEKTK
jgi:uncharacterized protein (TIGR02147 family)